jgi:nucleoside-diphosphate-sugar epimerase
VSHVSTLAATPQSILITGNLGYVGPGVVAQLRASLPDVRLVGLDTGYFAHCLTGVDALPERKLDCQLLADVRELPDEALAGVDTIVHLAAISNDPIGNLYENVTLEVNHRASFALARRAKAAGVRRFVFASSCSVYGASGAEARTESSELAPLTAYARSKVETERELQTLVDSSFSATCLRFATACGMSDRLRLDLVLNDFVASALTTGAVVLLSDGSAWRPLIHVADMARAIDWACSRDLTDSDPFLSVNVGSDEWNVQIRDLAEAVSDAIPDVGVTFAESAAPDKRSYRVDFTAFNALAPSHLRPQVGVEQAVNELCAGLERMAFTDERFREGKLIRLHTLNALRRQGLLDQELRWRADAAGHVS